MKNIKYKVNNTNYIQIKIYKRTNDYKLFRIILTSKKKIFKNKKINNNLLIYNYKMKKQKHNKNKILSNIWIKKYKPQRKNKKS